MALAFETNKASKAPLAQYGLNACAGMPAFLASVRERWQQLQTVLAARNVLNEDYKDAFGNPKSDIGPGKPAFDEDVAKNGLKRCGLVTCAKREASVLAFKACSACRAVWYCCPEHALEDWGAGHKKACSRVHAKRG